MVKERNCLTVRERLFPALSSWPLSSSRHRFYFANNDEKRFTFSISSYALSLSHQFYTLVIYLKLHATLYVSALSFSPPSSFPSPLTSTYKISHGKDFSTDAYSLFSSTLCGFGGETCASSAAARSARSEESRTLRAATIPAGV